MLYPIMTDSRGLCDLNGVWEFKLDDGSGFEEKWYEKPLTEREPYASPMVSVLPLLFSMVNCRSTE